MGLDNSVWFGKLDQCLIYLKWMCLEKNAIKKCGFQKPLLLAIATMDRVGDGDTTDFQLGVFLCSRKNSESNVSDDEGSEVSNDDFRMSLLWQARTASLEVASKMFGRTLMIAQLFGAKRGEFEGIVEGYKYLSSNCCKIQCKEDDKVCIWFVRSALLCSYKVPGDTHHLSTISLCG